MAVTGGEAMAMAKTAVGYLSNVKKAYDFIACVKSFEDQVKDSFCRLSSELKETEKNLTDAIQSAAAKIQYKDEETAIRDANRNWLSYLEAPGEYWKGEFTRTGAVLRSAVHTLLEGLLGIPVCALDIVQAVSNDKDVQGRPTKLRNRLRKFVDLVNCGILLHAAYVNLANISERDNAPTARTFAELYNSATTRIESEISKRESEDNVHYEMVKLMEDNRPGLFDHFLCDFKKLAEILYDFLADRYDSRQWLVMTLPVQGFWFKSYDNLSATFGAKFHCVSLTGGNDDQPEMRAFAISFPLNQSVPADFSAPFTIPYRAAGSYGYFSTLPYALSFKWQNESAGLLVKVLEEQEPRNHYFVLRVGYKDLTGLCCMELPVMFPPKSPLVKELLVGSNLKVIAFAKEDKLHENNSWEANVQHEMLDWMEKLETVPRTFSIALRDAYYHPPFYPLKVAQMLYDSLSSRYSSRQWIVIVHLRNPRDYRCSYLTFGTRCHYVIPDYGNIYECYSSYSALAISFPMNQTPPADFTAPTKFPVMTEKSYRPLPLVPVDRIWSTESAGFLVKALTDVEPRNDYFVIHTFVPAIMPNDSPLVRAMRVGESLHVIVLPKEDV